MANTRFGPLQSGYIGGEAMSRRDSIVSDAVKYEIAKELGFADRIQVEDGSYDYGNITTREAGLIVRGLIKKAEEVLARQG
jgi:small acid-soluble spore protein F (minor alpha/beta-type SASP)